MILFLRDAVKAGNDKIFKILPLILACFFAANSALGQVYKWADEQGRIHYGERPPQGAAAQTVPERLASPGGAPSSTNAVDWKSRDLEFRSRRISGQKEEEARERREQEARRACDQARSRLAQMRAARRFYRLNQAGERVYQDDGEREAEISLQETSVRQRCP